MRRFMSADNKGKALLRFMTAAMLLLFTAGVIKAQTEETAEPPRPMTPLQTFLSDPAVNAGSTAVYIAEIGGKVLASHNADTPLLGASTMKLVTIGSLMQVRDVNYRYVTRVMTAGRVVNNVLEGNLHIVGSGDPTLNTDRTPKTPDFVDEIVKALKSRGIKSIRGNVLIDQSIFSGPSRPQTWSSADSRTDYGAGAYGFNYGRNRSGSRAVENPSAVFMARLEKALAANGIALEKVNYTGGGKRLLVEHRSAPLDEIMRSCMMRSDNLYAECLLRQVAIAQGKSGSVADGAESVAQIWSRNKAPMNGVRIYDGSGLSRSDRLTAHFLAYVLRMCSSDPYYASFFPLAGAEGTLRSFLRGTRLETYVAMKTGSLHDVQAYAGYCLDEDYAPTHLVVVITNGFKGGRGAFRRAVEKLLLSTL